MPGFFALTDDSATIGIVAFGTALSLCGTVATLLTFWRFAWMRAPPRDLVLGFVRTDLFACLLTVLALALAPGHECSSTVATLVLFHFAFLGQYCWQSALCCSVYLSLSAMTMMLTDSEGSAERLMSQRSKAELYRKLMHGFSWFIPTVLTIVALATFSGCSDDEGKQPSGSFYIYASLDVLSFLFNVAMCCVNVRKARSCTFFSRSCDLVSLKARARQVADDAAPSLADRAGMLLLDLRKGKREQTDSPARDAGSAAPAGSACWPAISRCLPFFGHSTAAALGPAGSVHRDSIKQFKTYVGMFLLFGISRAPAVAISTVYLADGGLARVDHSLRLLQALLVPVQGFAMALWFGYKFRFWALWKRELAVHRRFRAQTRGLRARRRVGR